MGCMAAAVLAMQLGMLEEQELKRIATLCQSPGLEYKFPHYPPKWFTCICKTTKSAGGKLRLVLPEGIGYFAIRDDVPRQAVPRL